MFSYVRNGKSIEYEIFSSSPDNVIVIYMKSDKPGGLDMTINLQRLQDAKIGTIEDRIIMNGQIIDSDDPALGLAVHI